MEVLHEGWHVCGRCRAPTGARRRVARRRAIGRPCDGACAASRAAAPHGAAQPRERRDLRQRAARCAGAGWRNGARVTACRRLVARALGGSPCRGCPVRRLPCPPTSRSRRPSHACSPPKSPPATRWRMRSGRRRNGPKPRAPSRGRSPSGLPRASRRSAPRFESAVAAEVAALDAQAEALAAAHPLTPDEIAGLERALAALARELFARNA